MATTDDESCTVLWSTESGRAKACARRAVRILQEEYHVKIAAQSSFDEQANLLSGRQSATWILFVSTTGDGEHCDSIQSTWKRLLSKSLSPTLLSHVRFCLFCLGDRAYGEQFCAAGRKLGARLMQLGASSRTNIVGYGDDGTPNGGVFFDLDVWLTDSLLPQFQKRQEAKQSNVPMSSYQVQQSEATSKNFMESSSYKVFFASLGPKTAYQSIPLTGTIAVNQRLTDASWEQDTRHLTIRLSPPSANGELPLYKAGDVCTILPRNSDASVNSLLDVLCMQDVADNLLNVTSLVSSPSSSSWPDHCTLRSWLTCYVDICGLPEREDLRELSKYCVSDETQQDKLLSLSETSGSALYADYVLREKRSWRDVLYDFDGIQLKLESLFSLLPSLQPRHFSIASPSSSSSLDLCVAVVEGSTPLGRTYRGLCSSYLADAKVGDEVCLWLKPGSFQLPMTLVDESISQYETPILCIGAGTGVAPLRSLILEREARRPKSSDDEASVDARLVFGCRKATMDFYYQSEWNSLQQHLQVWTAFSRDQWHKVYVQQVLTAEKEMILSHLMDKGGAVYVAGGAKMARAVKDELVEILSNSLEGGDRAAKALLKRLQKQGKFAVEAWS